MAKVSVASKPKFPPPIPSPTQAQVEQFVQTMGTSENQQVTTPVTQVTGAPMPQSTGVSVHLLPERSVLQVVSEPMRLVSGEQIPQVTQSPKARGTVVRKRGPSVARIVAYLETSLGDQLLVRAASERRPISECVAEAVQQWLKPSNTT